MNNESHNNSERLQTERDQWKSIAQRLAVLASNSAGLASNIYTEMDELLSKEKNND